MKRAIIISQLATTLGRRDEVPNTLLAEKIASTRDSEALTILFEILNERDKDLAHDSIKTIYETAERGPELVAPYFNKLLKLLTNKNNRLQWGAMAGIDHLTTIIPQKTYQCLPEILDAMERGSVITRDRGMSILVTLAKEDLYRDNSIELIFEQLQCAPENQVAMYAEMVAPVMRKKHLSKLCQLLKNRISGITSPSKTKRLEKVLKQISRIIAE